jgi:hypothetical protein
MEQRKKNRKAINDALNCIRAVMDLQEVINKTRIPAENYTCGGYSSKETTRGAQLNYNETVIVSDIT